MRRKGKWIFAAVLVSVVGAVAAIRISETPDRRLRHALHLRALPSSVTNLRMGSDLWTDEVRGFYFEVAPEDFPQLLAGRQFRLIDQGGTFEANTTHLSPPVSFLARWMYRWETEGAHCTLEGDEKKTRVIAVFAAD